jgi:hypothetical protein
LNGEIRLDAHNPHTASAGLRKHPAELLSQTNRIIDIVRDHLPPEKRLLVVIEDLDKLDIRQARDVFVHHIHLLTGIRCDVLYTIPGYLFHSPDVNAFVHHFDEIVTLPMIKVLEPPNNPAAGFDTVKKIILCRLGDGVIATYAIYLLVKNTGGVLRHVFEVLHHAASMANVRLPLQEYHIRYGLSQLRKEFWHQITLPYDTFPEGPKSVDDLYNRLAEYGRNQMNGRKTPPKSDVINQLLLKTNALIEYDGEGWFGVHPLVMENLKELGRLT